MRLLFLFVCLTTGMASAQGTVPAQKEPVAPLAPPTLEELYSEPTVVDVAMSPGGRYIASIVRHPTEDLLVVFDLQTNERKVIQRAGFTGVTKNLVMKMAT